MTKLAVWLRHRPGRRSSWCGCATARGVVARAPANERRTTSRTYLAVVVGAFVVSRVVFHLLGVRFDDSSLTIYWQYLDTELLREHLLQSLLYLHCQPPLFNLFLGIILKLFPGWTTGALAVSYALIGLTLAVALFRLMCRLGVADWLAATVTILFSISPTGILYENWLHYPYPIMALLVLAALFLHRFLSDGRTRDGVAFFSCLAAVSLIMSYFHLVWLVAIAVGLLLVCRKERRRILRSACVPLLVVVLWYGKNLVLFDSFSSSTWLGMNLAKMTTTFVPDADLRRLQVERKVSGISLVPPFSPLEAYRRFIGDTTRTGVPVLDQETRLGGATNFNHRAYISLARQYMKDDLTLLRLRPQAYLRSWLDAGLMYFMPASANKFLRANIEPIRYLTIAYEILQGRVMYHVEPELQRTNLGRFYCQKILNMGFLLLIGYVFALIYAGRRVRQGWRERRGKLRARELALLFILFNLVSGALIGTMLEVGENPRFRSMVDPLWVLVIALFFDQLLRRIRQRRAKETTDEHR
jgi:hypothetical protein